MFSTKTWHHPTNKCINANDKGMVHSIDIGMLYTLMSYHGHIYIYDKNDERVRTLFMYTRNYFFSHPISHDT